MRQQKFFIMGMPPVKQIVAGAEAIGMSTRTRCVGGITSTKARAYIVMFTDDVELPLNVLEAEIRDVVIRTAPPHVNPQPIWDAVVTQFGAPSAKKAGSLAVTAADFAAIWVRYKDSPLKAFGEFVAADLVVDIDSEEVRNVVTQLVLQLPIELQAVLFDAPLIKNTDPNCALLEVQRGSAYKLTLFKDEDDLFKQVWKGVSVGYKAAEPDPAVAADFVVATGMQQILTATWNDTFDTWFEGITPVMPPPCQKLSISASGYKVPALYEPYFWTDGYAK